MDLTSVMWIFIAICSMLLTMFGVLNVAVSVYLKELHELRKEYRRSTLINKRQHVYIVKFLGRLKDMSKNDELRNAFSLMMDELSETEKL